MVKIVFHTSQIDVRGTCTAIWDYAHYNEILLNNKSIILTKGDNQNNNDEIAVQKFKDRFDILYYTEGSIEEIEDLIKDYDIIYTIKYGKNDGHIYKNIKNVIHAVFDMSEPHGDVFAGVSETLARKFEKTLFVPHMIGLPPATDKNDNLRVNLGIPKEAIVFGRHGGQDTFNLQFAMEIIIKVVTNFENIYFIFVNTPVFVYHPRIIFFDKIITYVEKNRFISTCDAHLECGNLGHTFGLSMGEFSINNKPIIVYGGYTWNNAHKDILGDKAIYFNNEEDFYKILTTFNPEDYIHKDLNCYKEYTPEKVMQKFKEIFIDG